MDSQPVPDVKNVLVDPTTRVTFHVFAYRALDPMELRQAVAQHLALRHKLRTLPTAGEVVRFAINIGAPP
jgi:hypothetical protein